MILADSEVRAIDAIVSSMDIQSMGFTYLETKETGRKPYSPVDMFKLYSYSYFNGIRSSRKIERECYRNIEVMWLINELRPDFKTIADFRKNNKKQIKAAFQRFFKTATKMLDSDDFLAERNRCFHTAWSISGS